MALPIFPLLSMLTFFLIWLWIRKAFTNFGYISAIYILWFIAESHTHNLAGESQHCISFIAESWYSDYLAKLCRSLTVENLYSLCQLYRGVPTFLIVYSRDSVILLIVYSGLVGMILFRIARAGIFPRSSLLGAGQLGLWEFGKGGTVGWRVGQIGSVYEQPGTEVDDSYHNWRVPSK